MLCNIKPVPFHESDKHIFAKIPGGVRTPGSPPPPPLDPPMHISNCKVIVMIPGHIQNGICKFHIEVNSKYLGLTLQCVILKC